MSKITQYLNEHILGEVTGNESVRKRFARDGGILSITPEIVVHPRVTNDIRKIARFTWQLAEKGHVLPLTVRGSGSNHTSSAIGKGIIVNTIAHLNDVIYINQKGKDQFVHLQPGVIFGTLNETLMSHGLIISAYPASKLYGTVAGAVASNTAGVVAGKYPKIGDQVQRLEVVLANGDLIETGRINKRELDKKKGLQTFEGEIYRKIDGIIEDNEQLINEQITKYGTESTGYSGIAKVKDRDGSFDLTPLFVGSQGTLGIISELVLSTDFYNEEESVIVATFSDATSARKAASDLLPIQPTTLNVFDGQLYDIAHTHGKKYLFSGTATNDQVGAVLVVSYRDYSDRTRRRKTKKTIKKLSKVQTTIYSSNDHPIEELDAIREVYSVILQPDTKDESVPSLIDGSSIPVDRIEEFSSSLSELAKKHHLELPTIINFLTGAVYARAPMHLKQLSDKQKVFKLIADYAKLVKEFEGTLCYTESEGRLKATALYENLDETVVDLYSPNSFSF
jgi:FAD/FMN-containing dehydrogenase